MTSLTWLEKYLPRGRSESPEFTSAELSEVLCSPDAMSQHGGQTDVENALWDDITKQFHFDTSCRCFSDFYVHEDDRARC